MKILFRLIDLHYTPLDLTMQYIWTGSRRSRKLDLKLDPRPSVEDDNVLELYLWGIGVGNQV